MEIKRIAVDPEVFARLSMARASARDVITVLESAKGSAKIEFFLDKSLSKEPWTGEGLPPVGMLVEALIDHSWVSAEVLAHGVEGEDQVAVLQVGSRIKTKTFTGIRPIRTPEQIAAEERVKACDEIYGVLLTAEREGNRSDMAEALYDAGYRKQVAP